MEGGEDSEGKAGRGKEGRKEKRKLREGERRNEANKWLALKAMIQVTFYEPNRPFLGMCVYKHMNICTQNN